MESPKGIASGMNMDFTTGATLRTMRGNIMRRAMGLGMDFRSPE
jgi:hypothetical protein